MEGMPRQIKRRPRQPADAVCHAEMRHRINTRLICPWPCRRKLPGRAPSPRSGKKLEYAHGSRTRDLGLERLKVSRIGSGIAVVVRPDCDPDFRQPPS
jgi:hypothetical protein